MSSKCVTRRASSATDPFCLSACTYIYMGSNRKETHYNKKKSIVILTRPRRIKRKVPSGSESSGRNGCVQHSSTWGVCNWWLFNWFQTPSMQQVYDLQTPYWMASGFATTKRLNTSHSFSSQKQSIRHGGLNHQASRPPASIDYWFLKRSR